MNQVNRMSKSQLTEYYEVLSQIQTYFPNVDIMTITAFMSDEEKWAHLERYNRDVNTILYNREKSAARRASVQS